MARSSYIYVVARKYHPYGKYVPCAFFTNVFDATVWMEEDYKDHKCTLYRCRLSSDGVALWSHREEVEVDLDE